MDEIFRPDNKRRRTAAIDLNKDIQRKINLLKSNINYSMSHITPDSYKIIHSTVVELKKNPHTKITP